MTKILTFKVGIEGLEDKIWRKIAITDRRTVADLAYTILATFDSLAYHLYEINYNGKRLICSPDENDVDDENIDKLKKIYDRLQNTTTFRLATNYEKGNEDSWMGLCGRNLFLRRCLY